MSFQTKQVATSNMTWTWRVYLGPWTSRSAPPLAVHEAERDPSDGTGRLLGRSRRVWSNWSRLRLSTPSPSCRDVLDRLGHVGDLVRRDGTDAPFGGAGSAEKAEECTTRAIDDRAGKSGRDPGRLDRSWSDEAGLPEFPAVKTDLGISIPYTSNDAV